MDKKRLFLLILLFTFLMVFGTSGIVYGENSSDAKMPLVTATFFDSDLREALKEVSLQTGVNIVLDENVKGVITLDLKNVPLEKALKMMVIGEGLTARKIDDFYVVGLPDPKNPAFAGLADTEVYYFKNITADVARALLPNFYSPYVKFNSSVKDPNAGIDPGVDSATVHAPPDLMQKILADLAKIDGEKKQIKIKALVTEIKNEVLKEWGMNLLNLDFTHTGSGFKNVNLDVLNGLIGTEGEASFGTFAATIKALVNDKKATIHADPVIVVTEGQCGNLFVGEKRTLILYSKGTDATTSSTENVEAGTTLMVSPKIVGDLIELAVLQKTSDFDGETTDAITVHSREFKSVVRFKPGQTVMVAGLTEKQTKNSSLKTPILGDIPIIGLLFKQRSDSKDDSELLVFLTAEVL